MSADNWAICPHCIATAQAKYDADLAEVMDSYGKVPLEEFDAARAALQPPDKRDYYTFREDYECYGAESGELHVSYTGRCSKCGTSKTFEHDEVWYEA